MQVVHRFEDIPEHRRGTWLAIGSFDGVHIGHQRLITGMVEQAKAAGGQSVVMTFDPHPLSVVRPEKAPRLLQTVQSKTDVLAAYGVDYHFVARFTPSLARLSPESFVREWIAHGVKCTAVFVGFDFTFGRYGRGTPAFLRDECARFHIDVHVVDPVCRFGKPVSSSEIRSAVAAGDVERAEALLGRPYSLPIRVVGDADSSHSVPGVQVEGIAELQLPAPGRYQVSVAGSGSAARSCSAAGSGSTADVKTPANPVIEAELVVSTDGSMTLRGVRELPLVSEQTAEMYFLRGYGRCASSSEAFSTKRTHTCDSPPVPNHFVFPAEARFFNGTKG